MDYQFYDKAKKECKLCACLLPDKIEDIKEHICNPYRLLERVTEPYMKEAIMEGRPEITTRTEIMARDVAPTMVGTLTEIETRYKQLQEFIQKQMVENEDYGKIPGCPKPSLFKPGAEKLLELYGYAVSDIQTVNRIEDWEKGFFHYEMKAIAISKRSGQIIGTGIGACNSKEKKYITQDPYTIQNTLLKMAKKRAIVDLALLVTRSSGIFTQDIEDMDINGSTKPKEATTDPKGVLTILEALKQPVNSCFDVSGILSDYKTETITKKDKSKTDITHYKILTEDSQYGIEISKWGKCPENIKLDDIVQFILVKVSEFKNEKKFLASSMDLVKTSEDKENS